MTTLSFSLSLSLCFLRSSPVLFTTFSSLLPVYSCKVFFYQFTHALDEIFFSFVHAFYRNRHTIISRSSGKNVCNSHSSRERTRARARTRQSEIKRILLQLTCKSSELICLELSLREFELFNMIFEMKFDLIGIH